jgi:predicted PurR-regulated permease PerM
MTQSVMSDILKQFESMRRIHAAAAGFIIAVIIVILLRHTAHIVFSVFAGLLFGVLLDGITGFVSDRTRLSRRLTLVLILSLFVVTVVAILWFGGTAIAAQVAQLQDQIPEIIRKTRETLEKSAIGRMLLSGLNGSGPSGPGVLGAITGTTFTIFMVLGDGLLVLLIGVFFAIDVNFYKKSALLIFPEAMRKRLEPALTATGRALRKWLLGQMMVMATLGILAWIGLRIVGTPLAPVLALITGLLIFVPFIGPISAAVPAVLVGLSVSPHLALETLGVYVVVQILENDVVTPVIQKYVTSLPPVLLISVQIAFGVLAGVIGILFATPITVAIVVLIQRLYVEDTLHRQVKLLGE